MCTEESNPVIEAIKKYKLKITLTFLCALKQFRTAFEEDSLDEYVEQNNMMTPRLERILRKACREMNRIYEERNGRETYQNFIDVQRPENIYDLIDLINPYKNPHIRSFKHAIHELNKIEKFIYEEQSKDVVRNTQVPNQEVAELLNESLMLISENDEIKALEEEKHFENFDITISEIEEKNSFYEIAESFRKNLDFSLLISDKEDKEELEFIDLINVFMLTSKNEFSFEWFHDMIKREIEKMVEHMETNNRKIIKLVKKGFLFDKPFSKQKQVRQSASENENKKAQVDRKSKVKFCCTYEDCGRVYSRKNALNVHIKKHHMNVKYQCQFCPKFFSSHQSCKIHTNKQHPDQKNIKLSLNV